MSLVILNGELLKRDQASIDIEDRGYQFGDGIYEVIRVYNGKFFAAKEHLQRLFQSAGSIGIKIPYTTTELTKMLTDLIQQNGLQLGNVYLQFTRGISLRKHSFPPQSVTPTFVAYTKEAPRPEERMLSGVKVLTTEDIRWLRCDIKSLNLLGNLLANQKAAEAGLAEAILHRQGQVTEGSQSNVFIVKNGVVQTHPANHYILNGITRRVVLNVCEHEGIPMIEKPFSIEELKVADEVFLTGTTVEIMPVIEIDQKTVGNGTPGPLTMKLQEKFKTEIEKQCGKLCRV